MRDKRGHAFMCAGVCVQRLNILLGLFLLSGTREAAFLLGQEIKQADPCRISKPWELGYLLSAWMISF